MWTHTCCRLLLPTELWMIQLYLELEKKLLIDHGQEEKKGKERKSREREKDTHVDGIC